MSAKTNILIGVGGTGAKVVEAALVQIAAGLGPASVDVGIVDQDGANGNVERTRLLLDKLGAFRERWSRPNARNTIDWAHPEAPALGRTRVQPLFETPRPNALWCPNQGQSSLASIIGRNLPPEHDQLFDLLFMAGGEEQELELARGYRGRAHVGSAAIVAALADQDNQFVSRLREMMADPEGGDVNIFIIGSAFGGTGAAGFPTLARTLHRLRADPDVVNRKNVHIGGLLMLPYFTFKDPEEGAESAVTSDELMPKARMALEYYDNLFAHEPTFDRFYALGWDPFIPLGYGETGGKDQANPALPPEIFGASAALRFFAIDWAQTEQEDALAEGQVPRMIMSRHAPQLKWRDFADPRSEQALGQLIRFAAYWLYLLEPKLREKGGWMSHSWASKLADKPDVAEAEAELSTLRAVLVHILLWAATIESMGGNDCWGDGPWTVKPMLGPQEPTPHLPVILSSSLDEGSFINGFDQMVRFDDGTPVTRAGHSILTELKNGPRIEGRHTGIGKAVAATYSAVRTR